MLSRQRLRLIHLRKNKLIRKYRNRYRSNKCKELENEGDLEDNSQKDVEEVRSQIKMQLELLRNRKKDTSIATSFNTDFINRTTPESWKKRLANNGLNVNEEKSTEDSFECQTDANEKNQSTTSKLDDVLLSNESGILIVDVIGGYKSPPSEEIEFNIETEGHDNVPVEENLAKNSYESSSYPIILTKTCDITKIKGWRTKSSMYQRKLQIIHRIYWTVKNQCNLVATLRITCQCKVRILWMKIRLLTKVK